MYVIPAGLVRLLGVWVRIQRDPGWNAVEDRHCAESG